MRLLVHGLNYAPDEIGIPKYTTELVEWLAARGWEIEVVTAPPYYPRWEVPPGYSPTRFRTEMRNGVRLTRCPLYVPAKPSGAKRLAHLASFALSSTAAILTRAARFKPDVVLAIAPALTAAPAAVAAARVVGCPALLHVQDFELDVAFSLGLLQSPRLKQALTAVERSIYRRFDLLSAPSTAMVDRLVLKGCERSRTFEFRNWADIDSIHPDVTGDTVRATLGVQPEQVLALYSGNLSEKQGVSLLPEAARHLAGRPDIRLVICGEGPSRERLSAELTNLTNVALLPLQPKERLPEMLAAADIHMLPQLAGAEDLVLPSKLSGMLASGRPVVATVTPGSGIAAEIDGAGLISPPGDGAALANSIARLADEPDQRRALGRVARLRAESAWAKDAVLAGFEKRLLGAIETRARQRT